MRQGQKHRRIGRTVEEGKKENKMAENTRKLNGESVTLKKMYAMRVAVNTLDFPLSENLGMKLR